MASNPIRWSYDTLVESFEVYHAGADPPRKLLDFAQQLSVFEPEKKAVAKKAKVEKAVKPKSAVEETAEVVKEVPQPRAARAPRARRGPVPQPFAAPEVPQPALPQPEDEQEHLTPEQYSDWMKYYRECAEYFEQCERNCAEQAGVELPRRAGIGQAPSAPAAPARAQAPSSPFHAGKAPLDSALSGSPWASLMPPPLPEGVAAQAPLLQALQALQLLQQQQQQLQQLQIQSVQQLISGSLLGGGLLGPLAGAGSFPNLQSPALRGLNSETLMNLLMAWYYSGYYTGEYAARQGKM